MEDINDLHASHIRKVEVKFFISSPTLSPENVTELLRLKPYASAQKGDKRYNHKGNLIGIEEQSLWIISSLDFLADEKNSLKDINKHLKSLLIPLSLKSKELIELSKDGERFIDVLWESSNLHAGTGPVIDKENLHLISKLDADIGFDIYQVDDDS